MLDIVIICIAFWWKGKSFRWFLDFLWLPSVYILVVNDRNDDSDTLEDSKDAKRKNGSQYRVRASSESYFKCIILGSLTVAFKVAFSMSIVVLYNVQRQSFVAVSVLSRTDNLWIHQGDSDGKVAVMDSKS